MAYRAMRNALRDGAMGEQGPLYDFLWNVKEFLNVFSGGTWSLEKGATAVAPTLAATAAELNRAADVSARLVAQGAGTLSVTEAAHDGKTILMDQTAAASTCTLPAATGSGARFRFVVSAAGTQNKVIQVTGNDVMYGNIIANSTGDTPDLAQPWPTAVDSDTITLNGTTTGGVAVGDFVVLEDIATDKWAVYGVVTASGTEATPFSAAV